MLAVWLIIFLCYSFKWIVTEKQLTTIAVSHNVLYCIHYSQW